MKDKDFIFNNEKDALSGEPYPLIRDLLIRLRAQSFVYVSLDRNFRKEMNKKASFQYQSRPETISSDDTQHFMAVHGVALQKHCEKSILPLIWHNSSKKTRDNLSIVNLTKKLSPLDIDIGGVAFPIRLGRLGNACVLFHGNDIQLESDILLFAHLRLHRVAKSILESRGKQYKLIEELNDREISCLQFAGSGYKSEQIAKALKLSVHTVNAYLSTATEKLDSVNRIQAIAKAIRLGIIA